MSPYRKCRTIGFTAALALTASGTVFANEAHNRLLRLPAAARTTTLAEVVRSSGNACAGISSEYKGSDKSGQAFWRIDCSNGKSFLVGIANDRVGSTKVLPCSLMQALTKKDTCFERW